MKKYGIIALAILAVMFTACISTGNGGTADDKAIARGVQAWNDREPSAAAAYWADIKDKNLNKKYQNYITLYNAGADALTASDSVKSTNETKLLSLCNTALDKFSAIDSSLTLPVDVCQK